MSKDKLIDLGHKLANDAGKTELSKSLKERIKQLDENKRIEK